MSATLRVWDVRGSRPTPTGGRSELSGHAFGPDLATAQAWFRQHWVLKSPPWDLADLVFSPLTPDPALTPPPVGGSLPSA